MLFRELRFGINDLRKSTESRFSFDEISEGKSIFILFVVVGPCIDLIVVVSEAIIHCNIIIFVLQNSKLFAC